MAKVLLECSCCGKIADVKDMEISQEYESYDEIEAENIICKNCFYDRQDNWAYNSSAGEFVNYEDYMASLGATICDGDTFFREY